MISQENTDEVMLKDIATALNDTHKLKEDCKQFDLSKDCTDICRISDDVECLVKRVIKLAIELIGNDTSLACDLMEDVQKEADLIIQCKTAKLVFPDHANQDIDENGEKADEVQSVVKDLEELELLEDKENKVAEEEAKKMDQRKGQTNHARRCLIIKWILSFLKSAIQLFRNIFSI